MNGPEIHVEVAPELALFVPHARRRGATPLTVDGIATLGHVVESLAHHDQLETIVTRALERFAG